MPDNGTGHANERRLKVANPDRDVGVTLLKTTTGKGQRPSGITNDRDVVEEGQMEQEPTGGE